jgi:predicted dinucleotide-binding enzyme
MKIAVIGHGNVGGTLASKWAKAGHDIVLYVRNMEDERVKKLTVQPDIEAQPIEDFARDFEVLLIATPADSVLELSGKIGKLKNQIVIDATNAIRKKPGSYPTAFHVIKDKITSRVVKCFNTTGFENMEDPSYGYTSADMFMAGDSPDAKKVADLLAKDAGFDICYDFGDSDQVKALEHLAYAWINLAVFQGQGRNIAFKILKK